MVEGVWHGTGDIFGGIISRCAEGDALSTSRTRTDKLLRISEGRVSFLALQMSVFGGNSAARWQKHRLGPGT